MFNAKTRAWDPSYLLGTVTLPGNLQKVQPPAQVAASLDCVGARETPVSPGLDAGYEDYKDISCPHGSAKSKLRCVQGGGPLGRVPSPDMLVFPTTNELTHSRSARNLLRGRACSEPHESSSQEPPSLFRLLGGPALPASPPSLGRVSAPPAMQQPKHHHMLHGIAGEAMRPLPLRAGHNPALPRPS